MTTRDGCNVICPYCGEKHGDPWQQVVQGSPSLLLYERFDGELLELSADVRGVAVAEADALDHEHEDHLTFSVHPALRAQGAAVAESSGRKHLRRALRRTDHAPAQSPTVAGRESRPKLAGVHSRHRPHRRLGDDPSTIELAAVEDHLIKPRHIGACRE